MPLPRLLSALRAAALLAVAAMLAAPAPAQQGRLFRLERAGLAPSYVYGTLHSDDPRVTALPAGVEDAMRASRSAAFETLLGDGDVQAFVEAAQAAPGEAGLADLVDATTLDAIRLALGAAAPAGDALARAKPWAALLMLAQPGRGGVPLDALLKDAAQRGGLRVFGLELPEEQVASLDLVPLPSQLALLRWALGSRGERDAALEATTRAWLAGDLAALRALALAPGRAEPSLAPHFAALLRRVIDDRNVLFAHRLHLPLARGRVFVAVGALHLGGPQGLLALLRRQGYRVVRVLRPRRRVPSRR